MWKKSKRILSCILALVLLLSVANSEQFFVQADTESAGKVQTEDVKNRSQRREETANEKGKEESTDKKEESSTKSTQKTEEAVKEDKKEQETTTKREQSTSKNEGDKKETGEKTEENKKEEEKTEVKSEENTKGAEEASTKVESSDTTENSAEEEKTEQGTETEVEEETQEQEPEELQTEEQEEMTQGSVETSTQIEKKEKEYIPESQPEGVVIKAYALESVFPEGTVLKVKSLGKKELNSTENVLKKGNVKYDGLFGYDISFYDKAGKEIEPENGSVRVVMQLSEDVLPEEADADTLSIQHLAEVKGGYNVEKVASVSSGSMQINSGKIKAEYTVDSFSEFVVTYSSVNSSVNTSKWKKEVKFYINKNSYIANSSNGGNGGTMKENFTGEVGSSTVSMPDSADTYPYTIEQASDGKSTAYIVIQGDQTGSAYTVDAQIRELPRTPYNGFSVQAIPSDENVLAKIKAGTVDVKVNGNVVRASDLTTDNFQVRWYVFKYNTTDQWHIDGILVPKSGRLKITKTFEGLSSDAINELKGKFAINVAGTTSYGVNQYSLSLDKGTASADKMTYTWEMDVYNTTYMIKETGMNLDNWTMKAKYSTNPDASSGQGAVENEEYDTKGNGFSMKCITKAKDVGSGEQSATLKNTYVRKKAALKVTKTITVNGKKVDNVTIQNLQFEIRDEKGNLVKTLSISDFTKNPDGSYEYSNPQDKFLEAGKTYTITEKNTGLDGYTFNNKKEECSSTITVTKDDNDTEKEVSFVNAYTKNIVPPTGASTTMTAWVLMTGVTVMLAVSFIVFDIRRKRFLP